MGNIFKRLVGYWWKYCLREAKDAHSVLTWILAILSVGVWIFSESKSDLPTWVQPVSKWLSFLFLIRAFVWLPVVRHEEQERVHADAIGRLKHESESQIALLRLDAQKSEKLHKQEIAAKQEEINFILAAQKAAQEKDAAERSVKEAQQLANQRTSDAVAMAMVKATMKPTQPLTNRPKIP
jgi:hypothetical protein